MTDHDKHLEEMKLLSSKLSSSEEKSREFFKSAGIHDEHGNLAEQYKAVDGWVTYNKYPTKTFIDWVNYPSIQKRHKEDLELCNLAVEGFRYWEKERQIRKN